MENRNFYKDSETGQVYEYDDQQVSAGFVLANLVQMSPSEVEGHLNPNLSSEQIIEKMRVAIQLHMDNTAKLYGYDDIKSAVTYADEPAVPKFQDEGCSFRAWRSLVWEYAYSVLDAVQAGQRVQPTAEAIIDELPELSINYSV